MLFGERGQLVQGDQDLGGTGVEDIDEITRGGDLSGVHKDIEGAEVLAQEFLCLDQCRDLDQNAAEVGDLLQKESGIGGGEGGVVGDKDWSCHDGEDERERLKRNVSPCQWDPSSGRMCKEVQMQVQVEVPSMTPTFFSWPAISSAPLNHRIVVLLLVIEIPLPVFLLLDLL